MKKYLLFLNAFAALSASTSASAENPVKTFNYNNLGSFYGIKVTHAFNVEVIKDNSYSATVVIDEKYADYLNVAVRNQVLVVTLKDMPRKLSNLNANTMSVKIRVPNLLQIDLSGATKLITNDTFTSEMGQTMAINASGASKIQKIAIDAMKAKIRISGASGINMTGKCGEFDIELSGASTGDLKLAASEADIDLNGAANFKLDCDVSELNLDITGASKAIVKGKADELEVECSGASNINAFDLKANVVDVELSGASKASISAEKLLKAEVSGASTCVYRGGSDLKIESEISRGAVLKKDK